MQLKKDQKAVADELKKKEKKEQQRLKAIEKARKLEEQREEKRKAAQRTSEILSKQSKDLDTNIEEKENQLAKDDLPDDEKTKISNEVRKMRTQKRSVLAALIAQQEIVKANMPITHKVSQDSSTLTRPNSLSTSVGTNATPKKRPADDQPSHVVSPKHLKTGKTVEKTRSNDLTFTDLKNLTMMRNDLPEANSSNDSMNLDESLNHDGYSFNDHTYASFNLDDETDEKSSLLPKKKKSPKATDTKKPKFAPPASKPKEKKPNEDKNIFDRAKNMFFGKKM